MNTTRGYGIAGHIGSYNSKVPRPHPSPRPRDNAANMCLLFSFFFQVRHGNWVEDTLSYERIQNPPPVYKNYTTEFRANFSQEYEVDPAEKIKQMRQTADLKAKNKDGMSYTTLFEHGNYRNKEEVCLEYYLDTFFLDRAIVRLSIIGKVYYQHNAIYGSDAEEVRDAHKCPAEFEMARDPSGDGGHHHTTPGEQRCFRLFQQVLLNY